MNQKKEVKLDEMFIRALENSKHPFRKMETGILGQYSIFSDDWYEYMEKEFSITCQVMDRFYFYYTDEQLLGLFILKWS